MTSGTRLGGLSNTRTLMDRSNLPAFFCPLLRSTENINSRTKSDRACNDKGACGGP